jgi:nucleoside-diphosphate-sugar epimerase
MDKFFEITGWKPLTDLELGIKMCIEKIKSIS